MRFLALLIFLFFHTISLRSQEYMPLLDNQNEWQLISCYEGNCLTDMYYTVGDTISNGKSYKVLDGYHYISKTFWLRENIQSKQIFLKTNFDSQNEETLLYDFSLMEGDSIQMLNPITPFPEDLGYFKLDSIRTKPRLENENSRFFYFSPTSSTQEAEGYSPIWVEGLGSLSLINAPGGIPDYNGVGQISCFWKNSSLFYHDDEMNPECQSFLNTKEFSKSKIQFALNRNNIGVLTNASYVQQITVFDIQGKKVLQSKNKGKSLMEINLSGFNKGIYILKVHQKGEILNIPFVLR